MKTEVYVKLKVPDMQALSAKQVLQELGFDVKLIERQDYYAVTSYADLFEELSHIDSLVNVNKHTATPTLQSTPRLGITQLHCLVTQQEGGDLKNTLMKTFGLPVKDVKHGVVWTLGFENESTARSEAKRAVNSLLVNSHYQEVEWL